ncbi:hypothetical protein DSL64_04675 [Dyadobacter luteus]|uniref:Lipoprotein n=2 Tax=Dyadobacter luteus TaxID=2259619 RepID=A0A3D8YIX4_9BACT|nr:hypothetical protein DSL64_04675 [Dyadobacter luteus]
MSKKASAMKKLFKSTIAVFTTFVTVLFLSCGGKDNSPSPVNCSNNAEKATAAATALASDPTNTAKCEAYKNAIRDLYKSCANYYTGQAKQDLDDFLATPCN